MNSVILAFQIVTGLFALYGLCEFIKRILDMYVICKSEAVCKIVLQVPGENPEYIIRFVESRFFNGDYADLFNRLEIPKDAKVDRVTIENLNDEFGNISY